MEVAGRAGRAADLQRPVPRARCCGRAEGDLLRVELVNRLDEPTNLHFHGLHVSPERQQRQCLRVGAARRPLPLRAADPAGQGGTFWYHPHAHHRLARQLWRGLAGPLIIDRPGRPRARAGGRRRAGRGAQGPDRRRRPAGAAHHRRLGARQERQARARQRPAAAGPRRARPRTVWLRLINACNGRILLLARADGRPLSVIAHDGHLLEAAQSLPEVLVTPAQRVDLLHRASTGPSRCGWSTGPTIAGPRREPSRRGYPASRCARRRADRRRRWPSGIGDARAPRRVGRDPSPAASRWRWRSSTPRAAAISSRCRRAWATWSAGRSPTSTRRTTCSTCTLGRSRSGGSTAWRRPIRPGATRSTSGPAQRVEILIPFRDFAGRSVFHCHIAEHGDAGMMGVIEVGA